MAKKSKIVQQQRLEASRVNALAQGKVMEKMTRHYNRCQLCGRVHSYYRELGVCRVCLRKYAREGLIMGLRKASW